MQQDSFTEQGNKGEESLPLSPYVLDKGEDSLPLSPYVLE